MPLKQCSSDGKSGWKWGDQGHCYTGPGAKKKAIKQGVAIEGPKRFKEIAKENEEVKSALSELTIIEHAFLEAELVEIELKGNK